MAVDVIEIVLELEVARTQRTDVEEILVDTSEVEAGILKLAPDGELELSEAPDKTNELEDREDDCMLEDSC